MIEYRGVSKAYGSRSILHDVNFRVEPGEFICITGKSGSGKSTVVHLLIRAEVPSSGVVSVDGKDLATLPQQVLQLYRRRTGVVFQDYKLLSDRTVAENVAFAMEVCGDDDAAIARRVPSLLESVGLKDRVNAYPHELSGGEKARAALARALVHHPMIVIADEPTGNIDPVQSREILALLKKVNAEGTTVILATHDLSLVEASGGRVLHLQDGTIVATAPVATSAASRTHQVFEEPAAHVSVKPAEATAPPRMTVKPIAIDSDRSAP